MTDFLLQATLSNLVVATVLAVIAWFVQVRFRSASLANLLWALVLIKMITPPLFSLPVLEVPSINGEAGQQSTDPHELLPGDAALNGQIVAPVDAGMPSNSHSQLLPGGGFDARIARLVMACWLLVSLLLFVLSVVRITRFHWLLGKNSCVDLRGSGAESVELADQLGLRKCPDIVVTAANVAPFVWWRAGRAIIVVSRQATQQLSDDDFRLVIAHEMAHIQRRDHWFRWLEWAVVIGFWWNPVMWWARSQLRISEEMACDGLVLEKASAGVHQYANSLLNMAELLVVPAIRPPVVASAINSGGNLEKRLKMIIAEKNWKVSAGLRLAILAVASSVFPLGVVYAQDFKAVERRLGGAVKAGELSLEQAHLMMEALKSSSRNAVGSTRDAMVKKFAEALAESGVKRESIRPALGVARRLAVPIAEGVRFEIRDDLSTYLRDDLDLTREQIGVVLEIAKRIAKLGQSPGDEENRGMGVVERLKAAVARGDMSEEDARRKLDELRRETSGGDQVDEHGMDDRKRRYMAVMKEVEGAVENGKLSKEEAERKLVALRKKMFGSSADKRAEGDSDDREMEARKRRYMELMNKIEAAVEAGELSKSDAEKKLVGLRKELFGKLRDKKVESDNDDREMEARKRRYMELMGQIEAAVDAGKLSGEEAEKKLIALRKELFGDNGGD